MTDIIVRSKNPYDFSDSELEELAATLRAAQDGLDVEWEKHTERGYGVTPYEVIEVVSTVGGAVGVVQMFAVTVAWMQERWRRQKAEHPERAPRPKVVKHIYGPDGRVLRSVTIDGATGEVSDDDVAQ